MKHLSLLILLIISCTPTEPEDEILIEVCDKKCYSPDGVEISLPCNYDCGDGILLMNFIVLNSQVFRHYLDIDNNNNIEPLEFGQQVWNNGRLIELDLQYKENVIMQPDNPTELDTTNYRLTVLPDSIGNFDALKYLKLNYNEIDTIPPSIGNLTNLKKLVLSENLITSLPDNIGDLVQLKELVINDNKLTTLPLTIGNLVSLRLLWAHRNQLEELPATLGNLSQLEELLINDNSLQLLPESIGNLESLTSLFINNNFFFERLPESLCNIYCNDAVEDDCISGLNAFSMDNNLLCANAVPTCIPNKEINSQTCAGCLPSEMLIEGECVDKSDYDILQHFIDKNSLSIIGGMQASDCYSPYWWDRGRLVEITFDSKGIYSEIPADFGEHEYIDENGNLEIRKLDKLEILDLHSNEITGEIPENIMNLTNLKDLKLNNNNFHGDIPINIGSLTKLETLKLNNNQLGCYEYDYECDPSGQDLYCCLTRCEDIDQCYGEIPSSIANLGNLKYLYLNENHYLRGAIPDNIGRLSNLRVLRLNKNQLEGKIPESIGNLINMERLYLANNNFWGHIPLSICNLYLDQFYYFDNNLCPPFPGSDCALVTNGSGQDTTLCSHRLR